MRQLFRLLVLILFILSCSQQSKDRMLSGSISGSNGKAPALAHIHIMEFGDNPFANPKTHQINSNGSFKVKIPKESYLQLMVTAADHHRLLIPLLSDQPHKNIRLKIQLERNKYVSDFSNVKVIGDWNKFRSSSAEPVQKQADGSYLFEKEIAADTVAYQLLNLVTDGRSINGPVYDMLVYDKGGDYLSVVNVHNGILKLVLDPAALDQTSIEQQASVQVEGTSPVLQSIIEIALQSEQDKKEENEARAEHLKLHGNLKDFSYNHSGLIEKLQTTVETNENALLKRYAALQLARRTSPQVKQVKNIYKKIIQLLPLNDPLWAAEDFGIGFIYKEALGEEEAQRLFKQEYLKIPNKKVRGGILVHIGLAVKQESNQEKLREIYNDLKTNYNDLNIGYFVEQLNPDQRISVGKTVPEFELQLLNSKKIISNKTFTGKYYLMDFWATWCGPCVGEMPQMHEMFNQFKNKNFTILSLSFDGDKKAIADFRKNEWKMPWIHVFLEGAARDKLSEDFEVLGIPKPLLVNPEGIIVAIESELRGENLEKTLAKFFRIINNPAASSGE